MKKIKESELAMILVILATAVGANNILLLLLTKDLSLFVQLVLGGVLLVFILLGLAAVLEIIHDVGGEKEND